MGTERLRVLEGAEVGSPPGEDLGASPLKGGPKV